VLLEIIVALTILATAGLAAVTMARQSGLSVDQARSREAEMRGASAFFDAASLWTRDDLDLRLGVRNQGAWRMRIDRPARTAYLLTLEDSLTGRELLRTALFRADSSRRAEQLP
jgi:type II secretory pathway pseudopilin PulG